MKLSDLIQQKLTVETWDLSTEMAALNAKLTLIKNEINNITIDELQGDLREIDGDITDVIFDAQELITHIDNIKNAAYEMLQAQSRIPLGESYDRYDEQMDWINYEFTMKCRELDQFKDNDPYLHRFNTLITKYTSWQHPTVYVRPNSMHFWDAMKASDILYVVDQCNVNKWLFHNLERNLFDQLRIKEVDEKKDEFLTRILPKNNVGLIVMEHFIHYKPMDVFKQYLQESFEILKPGGHLLFTYNNCDVPSGARNFENGMYCWQPGKMMRLQCELAGFEVLDAESSDRVSWFALKKPGELTSIKAGKTLGQILDEEDLD